MTETDFEGVLCEHVSNHLEARHSLGYQCRGHDAILRRFVRTVSFHLGQGGVVTSEAIDIFLASTSHMRPLTRRMRLSTVRQFLIYLSRFEPRTFVPSRAILPKGASPRPPRIFTDSELRALMTQALVYPRRYLVHRWPLYQTLIGVLYATGMRISEALALNLDDLDLDEGVVHVRKTKFHKARLIPLASSTVEALRDYLVARAKRGHSTTPTAPVFVAQKPSEKLPYSTAAQAFSKIAAMAGLRGALGTSHPRLHDLRHTAAVHRLYLWYSEGKDVEAMLPILVTYLGHSAVRCTETYLTATAELLGAAGSLFEQRYPLSLNSTGGGKP
jgi:integrase